MGVQEKMGVEDERDPRNGAYRSQAEGKKGNTRKEEVVVD